MEREDGDGPHLPTCVDPMSHPMELTCWPSGQIGASVVSQQRPLREMDLPEPCCHPACSVPYSTGQETKAWSCLASWPEGPNQAERDLNLSHAVSRFWFLSRYSFWSHLILITTSFHRRGD